ncbi:hypothetical protein HY358_01215 [Candidatus Roizmanbacteria bacterium]|nr:hypothetical protein [Candidatus Roizmanbacteria bacterium]
MIITFTINYDGDLLPQEGQHIELNDPLIKRRIPKEIKIPLSTILNVQPSAIFKTLKKFVGEHIQKGEILAETKGILSKKQYTSEWRGVVKEVNHHDGTVVIESEENDETMTRSFFKGELYEIEGNTIKLKVKNGKEYPLQKATADFGGAIFIATDNTLATITEEQVKDKILVAHHMIPFEEVKVETLGAQGIVSACPLSEDTQLPKAHLKQLPDWGKVFSESFPYCIVSSNSNTIYFYA